MTPTSPTAQSYLLAQNKSLEYELKIAELKLHKLQDLNTTLQEELHLKELEVFSLNQKLERLEQKPKQLKRLKVRVEQL